jgi:hypothetical protein
MNPVKKFFSLAVVGVCALALVSSCKKKADSTVPSTTAAATQPVAAPPAAPAALQIVQGKQLKKDIDAMPELADTSSPVAQKINATMKNWDAQALSMLKDCKSYTRTVSPTMLGPGYFSVWQNESWDCGAHPNVSLSVLIFDLNTGEGVDWTKLVKAPGVTNYSDSGADGKLGAPQALIDPSLNAAYMKWAATQDGFSDCKDAFNDPQSYMIWPEAKSGMLMVEPFDLPHVVQACANDMTLTLDQAQKLGFSADLLKALAAAHQQPGAEKLASPGS